MLKISKKIIFSALSVLLIGVMCLPMYSCGLKDRDKYTNYIMDSYGRDVSIPKNVEKIATVGSATRLVVYAGAIDKLCAITEMDRPTELRPYTMVNPELFSTLPTTNNGNHLNEIDVDTEKLIELQPDIIISSRSAEECDDLENKIKIPVVGAVTQNEILQTSLWEAIQVVARAAGTDESANILLGRLNKIYGEVSNTCIGGTASIYRGAVNYKGSKGITGTISNFSVYQAIKANSVSDIPDFEGAYDTTLEQLLSWNPDYIVFDCTNINKVLDDKNNNPQVFDNLKAFRNNNVYMAGPFNNNGTNSEYGLCEMFMTAKMLYPDKFSYLDLEEKYREIIKTLLGKDIYPELKARGISFGKASF